jgi:hypothetical protein
MTSTEQLEAPKRTRPMLLGRLAGTAVAAVLIAIGVVLATRPVGDEAVRARATSDATASVYSTRPTWDGAQLLTVSWTADSSYTGQSVEMTAQLEAASASPPWQVGDAVDVLYDPVHPADVVFADPTWAFNTDFRVDAAFQSAVPFALAALALGLLVFGPTRQSEAFAAQSLHVTRRSLRRYLLTVAVLSSAAVVPPFILQDQPLAAYSPAVDFISSGPFVWLTIFLLIWLCVRGVRFARIRRLLTSVQDAADGAAVIRYVSGRRLWISSTAIEGSGGQKAGKSVGLRLRALPGQSRTQFVPGDRVRLYCRGSGAGPAIITDGVSKVLAGFGRQAVARIADPLAGRYPRLGRKLRQYRTSAQTVPVSVCAVSIAVVVIFGLNPAWLWLPVVFDGYWLTANLVRYYTLSPILRGPFVESDGVVHSITRPRRRSSARPAVVIVDVPEQPKVRVRLVGDRRVSWLSEGQEVVISQGPDNATGPAVLAARDGHAELAIAKPVELVPDSITDTLDRQFPALRGKLMRFVLARLSPLVVVCGGSLAITLGLGLNPGWLWTLSYLPFMQLWLVATYVGLSRLLRRPYVAHHVVVVGISGPAGLWPYRAPVVNVEITDQPPKRLRLIGDRDTSWLTEGQEGVLMTLPKENGDHAVLATADGHAALVLASSAQPTATEDTAKRDDAVSS